MTNEKESPFEGSPCLSEEEACGCFPKEIVIKEEEEALAMLRDLKSQVHAQKARLAEIKQGLEADGKNAALQESLKACEEKLAELRVQWDEWDRKRQAATREKLIRLGHISPDDPSWKVS